MGSDNKRKINILQKYGTSHSFFQLESNTWKGIMYSCNREDFDSIVSEPALRYYGVYILLSDNKVYVGQATNLLKRTKDHMVDKNWWNRIILLTDKNNTLTLSDIDYIENVMIEKVKMLGDNCDNNKNGNPKKVDEYRKVDLDDYLRESFDLLKFIGICIFDGKKSFMFYDQNSETTSYRQKTKIISKSDAVSIVFGSNYPINKCTYAKLQEKQGVFWANPSTNKLSEDWDIILNNQNKNELIVLHVPSNSFTLDKNKENHLELRDTGKIDLNILNDSYKDRGTGSSFKKYIIRMMNY